jgi:hypothetical protein
MAWITLFAHDTPEVWANDDPHSDPEIGRVQTLHIRTTTADEVTIHEMSPERIIDLGRHIAEAGEKLKDEAATRNLEAKHAECQKARTLAELDQQFAAIQTPKPACYCDRMAPGVLCGNCLDAGVVARIETPAAP